jgi:hypothetical protein
MTMTVNHAVKEFRGMDKLEAVIVEDRATGSINEWKYDGVFVFIGLIPNSELVKGLAEVDQYGFIVTDKTLMTNRPDLFAIGDVRSDSYEASRGSIGRRCHRRINDPGVFERGRVITITSGSCHIQPPASKSRATQTFHDVRALFQQPPYQPCAEVFDHENIRTLIDPIVIF